MKSNTIRLILHGILMIGGEAIAQTEFVDSLKKGDTLLVNYCESLTEFGSVHEGIIIHKTNGELHAKAIIYDYGVRYKDGNVHISNTAIPISFESKAILDFYDSMNLRFFVVKDDWILDADQVRSINFFIGQLWNYFSETNSTRVEYFTVIGLNQPRIVKDIDRVLRKSYLDLKKQLKIPY